MLTAGKVLLSWRLRNLEGFRTKSPRTDSPVRVRILSATAFGGLLDGMEVVVREKFLPAELQHIRMDAPALKIRPQFPCSTLGFWKGRSRRAGPEIARLVNHQARERESLIIASNWSCVK